jgi:hypothetical protein
MSTSYVESAGEIFPWKSVGAVLAEDAMLHGPLFTRPLHGARKIEEFYRACFAVAGPVQLRWSLSQDADNLILGDQIVEGRQISSGFWLQRDASGEVTELSHGMRPFTRLPPFHDAMRRRLEGFVPDEYWELDEAARVGMPVGEEMFPPLPFEDDVRFFVPVTDKPLQGPERVRGGLDSAMAVYGKRRYLVRFPGREALGSVFEGARDGHIIRCISVVVMSPTGAVKDIIGCMLPYPVFALIYHAAKERNFERLGAEYFSI